jgi:flavin-dependent dehydrogenase
MTLAREIEIIGGGLAGLSLGLALQRAGVPVTVREAGDYPRHRVCGEFITGLDAKTIARLGLGPFLHDARPCREVTWYRGDAELRRHSLPEPARAISRFTLDQRLAEGLVAAGGQLVTGAPVHDAPPKAGRVFAAGKHLQAPSPWLGLKLHARNLPLAGDLELHLGTHAYVGLCRLDDEVVNVCGLFRRQKRSEGAAPGAAALLLDYLRQCGLAALAQRLAAAEPCPASPRAIAGLNFSGVAAPADRRLALGDAFTQIPPFTGNGMAMAFQSAECALDPLIDWSHGALSWETAVTTIRQRLRRRFRRRLAIARSLHPFLLSPQRQRLLAGTQQRGWLPMASLYRLVH